MSLLFLGACETINYLPRANDIGGSPYGAFAEVITYSSGNFVGEIISVDTIEQSIVIRIHNRESPLSTLTTTTFSNSEIKDMRLRFAQRRRDGALIPLYALSTLSHGVILVATAPINIIVTGIVVGTSNKHYRLKKNEISWKDMCKFARFPQGLPPNISLQDIK